MFSLLDIFAELVNFILVVGFTIKLLVRSFEQFATSLALLHFHHPLHLFSRHQGLSSQDFVLMPIVPMKSLVLSKLESLFIEVIKDWLGSDHYNLPFITHYGREDFPEPFVHFACGDRPWQVFNEDGMQRKILVIKGLFMRMLTVSPAH